MLRERSLSIVEVSNVISVMIMMLFSLFILKTKVSDYVHWLKENSTCLNTLCARMGWLQLKTIKYEVFFELSIEFYTTLKIIDDKLGIFSCRFCGKEYLFDYELMFDIFDFF